jgi:hypothetical protein
MQIHPNCEEFIKQLSTPPGYQEPGMCVACQHGEHYCGNPYQFYCKKYPDAQVVETGVCNDYVEQEELVDGQIHHA